MTKKEIFRQTSLEKIRRVTKQKKLKNQQIVLEELELVLKQLSYRSILGYVSMKSEVDVLKVLGRTRRKNTLLVPFMEGVSFKLVKFRLPLFKKKFNIREPMDSLAVFSSIDIAVVPVVGVDGELRRIGFGKGMYDRFFASLQRRPLVIFVQLADCFTKQHISDAYDIQADIYISPNQTIIKRGTNDFRTWNRRRRSRNKRHRRVLIC